MDRGSQFDPQMWGSRGFWFRRHKGSPPQMDPVKLGAMFHRHFSPAAWAVQNLQPSSLRPGGDAHRLGMDGLDALVPFADRLDERQTHALLSVASLLKGETPATGVRDEVLARTPHRSIQAALLSGKHGRIEGTYLDRSSFDPHALSGIIDSHQHGTGMESRIMIMNALKHPSTPESHKLHAIMGCDSAGCYGCNIGGAWGGAHWASASPDLIHKVLSRGGDHHLPEIIAHCAPESLGLLPAETHEQVLRHPESKYNPRPWQRMSEETANRMLADDPDHHNARMISKHTRANEEVNPRNGAREQGRWFSGLMQRLASHPDKEVKGNVMDRIMGAINKLSDGPEPRGYR